MSSRRNKRAKIRAAKHGDWQQIFKSSGRNQGELLDEWVTQTVQQIGASVATILATEKASETPNKKTADA